MSEQVKKKIREILYFCCSIWGDIAVCKKQANKKKASNSKQINKKQNPIQTIPGSVMNQNNVNTDYLLNNRRHRYIGGTKSTSAHVYVMAMGM